MQKKLTIGSAIGSSILKTRRAVKQELREISLPQHFGCGGQPPVA
jgi:hypothetical protein